MLRPVEEVAVKGLADEPGTLILCRPNPAGAAQEEEFFLYRPGRIDQITRIANDVVPTILVEDDSGARCRIRRQNGWLVDFTRVGHSIETWAVFAKDAALHVQTPTRLYDLGREQLAVGIRRFGFFARVSIKTAGRDRPEVNWIRFPWWRTWFIDGDTRPEECDPFCDLFNELATEEGRNAWLERWTSGLAVRNTAIHAVTSLIEANSDQ